MHSLSPQSSTHRRRPQPGGYTLVEVLITLALGSFILTGILTSYVFSVRAFSRLSNYNEIQAAGRQSLDWFARDIRAGIQISSCTATQVVVLLPQTVSSSGVVTATNTVTHKIKSGVWYRNSGGVSKPLTTNVTSLAFSLYDQAGNVTTQVSQAVSVQVDAFLTKSVQNKNQTTDFLSARYRMRNTP